MAMVRGGSGPGRTARIKKGRRVPYRLPVTLS